MKRTTELVLSVIGAVCNFLSVAALVVMLMFFQYLLTDPLFSGELDDEMELYYDDYSTSAEYEADLEIIRIFSGIGWFFAILGIIGIILSIIGIVKIKSNTKLAGILLIISSVLSGLISIPGILFMIAGVMCLVRKPKNNVVDTIQTDENGYIIE